MLILLGLMVVAVSGIDNCIFISIIEELYINQKFRSRCDS